jgi:rRNA maturation endonuclease Nob1
MEVGTLSEVKVCEVCQKIFLSKDDVDICQDCMGKDGKDD